MSRVSLKKANRFGFEEPVRKDAAFAEKPKRHNYCVPCPKPEDDALERILSFDICSVLCKSSLIRSWSNRRLIYRAWKTVISKIFSPELKWSSTLEGERISCSQ